jgi:hypothetical protein
MGKRTSDDDSSHFEGALLEDILDRVKAIAQGQTSLWDKVDGVDKRLERVEENSELIPVIKDAVKAQLIDYQKIVSRVDSLEQAT